MLHGQALTPLKQQGVAEIQPDGCFHYFWQGVPLNLPDAWSFFQAQGWTEQAHSFDLVRTLAEEVSKGFVGATFVEDPRVAWWQGDIRC
jgi:hypothetical protein